MKYRRFQNILISELGMGTMRLPVVQGNNAEIDIEKTEEMIDLCIRSGINYFDTAWGYHGGHSETVIGEILSKYDPSSYYIATKFPGYDLKCFEKAEQIFNKQLEHCKKGYIDFYLLHNVCERNIDAFTDERYGVMKYILEQKSKGYIKHIGFSAHGGQNVLQRLLQTYGEYLEFGQLQINYIDWKLQEADKKVELFSRYNLPIWVMEPLRGGSLAHIKSKYRDKLSEYRKESDTGWAFNFLLAVPGVTVILSGMSDIEQLKQNIATFDNNEPLNSEEFNVLLKMAQEKVSMGKIPCTACKYCISECPRELDIPGLIKLYNEHADSGGGFIAPIGLMTLDKDKQPGACKACRSCEAVCPQKIEISKVMKDIKENIY